MLPCADFEVFRNGLKVVYVRDDHAESICFGLFVASGSRHETVADAGASHFIEHMLFKGTAARSALAISQAIEGRGGNFNAWTSEEGTCFYAYVPAEALTTALDILTDMYLHAALPRQEFLRERRVILEEIKMYDDEPDAVASENLSKLLFPDNALGAPVAGNADALMRMTPASLRRYLKSHYVPAATVAVVTGRFDVATVRNFLRRRLGALRLGTVPACVPIGEKTPVMPEMRVMRDIQQVQLALGYRIFGVNDRRRHAATVFDAIMGRAMSSRLFQSVRERRGLSYDIHSQIQFFAETGGWCITAGVDSSRARAALAAIDVELDRICQKKPPVAEMDRTRRYLLGNFRLGFEQPRSRLFYFGLGMQAYGRIVPPEEVIDGISSVTADDVQAVAQTILNPKRRAISWVEPKR